MDGKVIIGTELDTKGFDKEIAVLEDRLNDIKATLQMADEDKTLFSTREIKEMEAEAQKLGRRIDTLKQKQAQLNNAGFSNMKASIENVGKSVQKVTKKVVKWALAVFGLRSAYMAVRRAASTISQYNEKISTDLSYIQYSLATALEPIIRVIIDLAYKLLSVINSISMALFNYNLFQNASIDKFKKMNTGATKLKKTLAGFDEMNILGDESNGSGSSIVPSFDLSKSRFNLSEWIESFDWSGAIKTFFQKMHELNERIRNKINSINWVKIGQKIGKLVLEIDWAQVINDFIKSLATAISILPKVAWGMIKQYFTQLWDKAKENAKISGLPVGVEFVKSIFKGIIDAIKFLPTTIYDNFIQPQIDALEEKFGKAGKAIGEGMAGTISEAIKLGIPVLNNPVLTTGIKGIKKLFGLAKGGIVFPKLASGGVINMPGRGVPLTGAIGGEHGAEGVIPLTDSQQMALLGESIGKYITVNANITTTMNGRVISRELQKINNESDFAFNR